METGNTPKETSKNVHNIAIEDLLSPPPLEGIDNMEIGNEPSIPKETDEILHNMLIEDVLDSLSNNPKGEKMDIENEPNKELNENIYNTATQILPAFTSSEIPILCNIEIENQHNIPQEMDENQYDTETEGMPRFFSNNPEVDIETDDDSSITNENVQYMATEYEPASSSTSECETNPLEGWTKNEKYYLYKGLKHKGSKDAKVIQEYIPTKTSEEIVAAIDYYKKMAHKNPECSKKKLKIRNIKTKPLIPLASWAKLLTDKFSFNELQTETANVLRLIADLDDIPPSTWTEQIDFRKVYYQIADAMEGKSLSDIRLIVEVLNSCILETALVSKQFINSTTLKNIVSSIDVKEKVMAVYPRPTKDCELSIIRHLACQENYNPLGINEDSLLPMSTETIVHPK